VTTRHRTVQLGLDRFSGLYIWALFILVFSLWVPGLFFTAATAHTIASEQAIDGFLAIAVLLALVTGTYDLSVGAVANLSTIVVTWLQVTEHFNVWLAIVVAVAASCVIGVVNGFVVVRLRVNSFIATLGMGTILAAVQIEDLIGMEDPVNVPGTDREYPNWQRKLTVDVEDLETRVDLDGLFADLSRARG